MILPEKSSLSNDLDRKNSSYFAWLLASKSALLCFSTPVLYAMLNGPYHVYKWRITLKVEL